MPAVKGAKSWFQFGGFSIQPSEFAKLGCSLAFARYLSLINTRTQNLKNRLTAGAIVMIPALLIMVQPDPGTADFDDDFGFNETTSFFTDAKTYNPETGQDE